ncbi:MAG TPA: endonuclease/exonuclease/phosphatase family protein [Candidatus Binatia bacterium]|nr:endonuclease/exonuclease/phosphatase family protein [Candidatus Binatia bacterium]
MKPVSRSGGFAAAIAMAIVLQSSVAGGKTLGVLTYNVHGLPAVLIGSRDGEVRKIARILDGLRKPDSFYEGAATIVALQEVFAKGYHRTVLNLAAPSFPFATARDDGGTYGLGDGLVRLSDAPFARHVRIAWKECFGRFGLFQSDCDTRKGFSYARHEVAPGAFVDVYDVHADAGQDPGSRRARAGNIRQLLDAMRSLSPAGTAVIVLGDTNARYTRSPRDNVDLLVTDGGLRDVWIDLVRDGQAPVSGPPLIDGCAAEPGGADCELVDKILYRSGDGVTLRPMTYEVLDDFRDKRGRELSDHFPVAAKFDVEVAAQREAAVETAASAFDPPAELARLPGNPASVRTD